jgi:hypothetical protein
MKISQLAKKPQLISVTIDDEDIVAEYGEAIEFWTWDRQPMDVFLKLATVDVSNTATVIEAVRELILDENGQQVLTGDVSLPTTVMMRVITRIVDGLGKF